MGGEEETYPHGSAEQAVPRPQPSSIPLQREDPRYHHPYAVCPASTPMTRTRRPSVFSGRSCWDC